MRARLPLGRVVTGAAFVVAVPATTPSTENVTVLPATGELFKVRLRVAESDVVPKYVPAELATMKLLAASGAETVTALVAELLAGFGSTADELLASAVLLMMSPFKSVLIVEATMVAVPDWPLASE